VPTVRHDNSESRRFSIEITGMSDGRANRLVDAVGEFDAVALATEFGPESGAG
jgi:hypothetical protein